MLGKERGFQSMRNVSERAEDIVFDGPYARQFGKHAPD